ncbi:MAG: hypothetical protein ILO64_00980 [Clostridia bacterium]|nr:hypothetical protein [Clostridia bacterium]
MKRISVAVMLITAAAATVLCGAFLLWGGGGIEAIPAKRECAELLAACLAESVFFAVLCDYIL